MPETGAHPLVGFLNAGAARHNQPQREGSATVYCMHAARVEHPAIDPSPQQCPANNTRNIYQVGMSREYFGGSGPKQTPDSPRHVKEGREAREASPDRSV